MHLCIVYIDHEAFSKSETEMHDHVICYHVKTILPAYKLLQFNIMVGKRERFTWQYCRRVKESEKGP